MGELDPNTPTRTCDTFFLFWTTHYMKYLAFSSRQVPTPATSPHQWLANALGGFAITTTCQAPNGWLSVSGSWTWFDLWLNYTTTTTLWASRSCEVVYMHLMKSSLQSPTYSYQTPTNFTRTPANFILADHHTDFVSQSYWSPGKFLLESLGIVDS